MTKTSTKALIAYPGSKHRLAPSFEHYYPPHRHFIAPFGGSGAEIMKKRPSPVETWNDMDDHLYDMFRVLQDERQYGQLLDLINSTVNGREQYLDCRLILDAPRATHPRVKRVWAFLICSTIGFRGPHPLSVRSWSDHVTACSRATKCLLDLPTTLQAWKDRFRTVRLEHLDWPTLFRKYDSPSTFWFLDPPYHPATLSRGGLYTHLLSIQDHEKLLLTIRNAQGYVLLCGYDHPLYTSYLFPWRTVRFRARAIMGKSTPRREVIWLNYDANNHRLGGDKLLIAKRYVDITGGAVAAQRYLDRIAKLLSIPIGRQMVGLSHHSRQAWRKLDDDGRANASTKLQIAKHYVEMMGGADAAQRYLNRIIKLITLFQ